MLERLCLILPPITATQLYVLLTERLTLFILVYTILPLIFLFGFNLAFHDFPELFFVTGFIANTAFMCAFYPAAWDGYSRGNTYRLYEAMYAATVPFSRIMAEEMLWYVLRGVIGGLTVGLAGLLASGHANLLGNLLLAIPAVTLSALFGAACGMLASSMSRSNDDLTYFDTMTAVLFVFSGTFLNIAAFPQALQTAIIFLPLYHGIELVRLFFPPELVTQAPSQPALGQSLLSAGYILAFSVLCAVSAYRFYKKRLFT